MQALIILISTSYTTWNCRLFYLAETFFLQNCIFNPNVWQKKFPCTKKRIIPRKLHSFTLTLKIKCQCPGGEKFFIKKKKKNQSYKCHFNRNKMFCSSSDNLFVFFFITNTCHWTIKLGFLFFCCCFQ